MRREAACIAKAKASYQRRFVQGMRARPSKFKPENGCGHVPQRRRWNKLIWRYDWWLWW